MGLAPRTLRRSGARRTDGVAARLIDRRAQAELRPPHVVGALSGAARRPTDPAGEAANGGERARVSLKICSVAATNPSATLARLGRATAGNVRSAK